MAGGLAGGEFLAHLQPQVDLGTGRVVGVEALARWERPGGEILPPAAFLPWIEGLGMMAQLTDVILNDALRWCVGREGPETEPIAVAVNVSAASLDKNFVSQVARALERWQVPPHRLTVEITETAIMHNALVSVEVLGCLKSLGVQLSIDDFGTGYSSLARLNRLPIDEIKIDRGFVRDLREGADSGMVRTIAALGRNFGLRVVAEGVEHEPELTRLAAMGCDLAQGYIISPALPPASFEDWLGIYSPVVSPSDVEIRADAGKGREDIDPAAVKPGTRGIGERLRALSRGLRTQGELEPTMERLLGELARELGARFAACWLQDPASQQIEPLAFWSAPGSGPRALMQASRDVSYAPGRGLPGCVLAADKLVKIADLQRDTTFLRIAAARQSGCSSAVAFPLRSNDRPIGVLEFLGSELIPGGAHLAVALRDVGALIGEFVSARQAEQRSTRLTEILATAAADLTRLNSASPDRLATELCAATQQLTRAHAVLLWQPRPDARVLTVTATAGLEVGPLQVSLTDEHSGAAAAFHAGRPIFIADVAHHAVPSKRLAAAAQAASALYHPIRRGNATFGVLAIAWKDRLASPPHGIQSALELLTQGAAPPPR